MIVITLDDNTELAIYKEREVKAERGCAIGELLRIIADEL